MLFDVNIILHEQMYKIVINRFDVRGCYSSGIMKPLLIFTSYLKMFYRKGDQGHAHFVESFSLITLSLFCNL